MTKQHEAGADSMTFFSMLKIQDIEEKSKNQVRVEKVGILLDCNFNDMSSFSIP